MKKNVKKILDECLERHSDLQTCSDSICRAFDILVECHSRGSKLLVCGNGGSAADAEHITGELMNRFMLRRPVPQSFREKLGGDECGIYLGEKLQQAFRAVSLVSQSALITAIANDLGPDLVFAQQVYGYGKAGDVLLAVSTSGNSANVLNAIRVACALQVEVIGLTGRSGGRMSSLCDVSICTPSDTTPLIQESHLVLYHTLCAMVEAELFS